MNNQTIKFNQNWNNKLSCNSFSTIRISNKKKYVTDKLYDILLYDRKTKTHKNLGTAKLLSINEFLLNNVSPAMCLLDTNYNKPEFIKMFKTMYKNFNIDFSHDKLMFIVLQFQK